MKSPFVESSQYLRLQPPFVPPTPFLSRLHPARALLPQDCAKARRPRRKKSTVVVKQRSTPTAATAAASASAATVIAPVNSKRRKLRIAEKAANLLHFDTGHIKGLYAVASPISGVAVTKVLRRRTEQEPELYGVRTTTCQPKNIAGGQNSTGRVGPAWR